MKKQKIISFIFTWILLFTIIRATNLSYAGWVNDTVGDAEDSYFDITKLEISKTSLKLTLSETPYFNDSGDNNWRFYNIWIDTSMEDANPDTESWSTEVYEYVAHFDCRWDGSQWLNNSYIQAFRYYLTADGSEQVEGNYFWDGNSWETSDPDIDGATVTGNSISFNIDGAIFREDPLGTGYVIQGVANAGTLGDIQDISPNNGWLDEFDNECVEPSNSNGDNNTEGLASIGLFLSIVFIGITAVITRIIRQ